MKKVLFASGLKIPASTINKPVQNSKKEFALDVLNCSKGYFEALAQSTTSKSTYNNYRSDLKKFVIWSIKQNRTIFPKLDSDTIALYSKDVQNKFAKSSLSRQTKFLKSLSKWFEINGFSYLTNHTKEQAEATGLAEANGQETQGSSSSQTVGATASLLNMTLELEKLKKWGFSYKPLTDLLGIPSKTQAKKNKLHFSQRIFLGLATMALVISGSTFMLTPSRTQISLETPTPSATQGQVLAAVSPPRILSFQGRVTNASGSPIIVATNFVYKIYDAATSGTLLWTSKTWSITPDSNGIFSVLLGDTGASDTAIPSTLFSENATLYLGVTVAADSEMTPRQRIVSSAYALNADALAGYFPSQTPILNQVPVLNASGNLIFGGATTIGTLSNTSLTLAPNGSGDVIMTNGEGSNIQINQTPTSDATIDGIKLTLTPSGTGTTGTLQGVVISQADTATTGAFDTLLKLENLKTPETTTNGLFIQQNAAAGTLTNGINITNTAGTLTNGIQLTGTFGTTLLDTPSLDISGTGAITGATGVTSLGTFDINTSGSTAINIGTGSYSGTATLGNASANIAITDANWSITGAGVGSFTGITSSGTITFSSLNTVGAIHTVASGGVINQVNPSATSGDCLKSTGTGTQPAYSSCTVAANSLDFADFQDTLDLDANLILNQAAFTWAQNFTPTTDATANGYTYTLTPSGTGATGVLNGMLISQADTATTGAFDTLLKVENLKTPETVANGIQIVQNAAAGTLTNGINITNTAGTLTNGIQLTGTFGTTLLDTPSLDISGTGAITGATGVTSLGTFDINTSGSTAINIGTGTYTGILTLGNTSGAGALNLRAGSGNFTLDGVAGTTYTIGAATTTGTMTIGGTAQTGLLTLGQSSGTNIVAIGSGTGATTVQIATGATNAKTVQIGTGAVANTITIGSASTTGLSLTDDNWSISTAGLITTASNIAVNGGSITTTAATFNHDVANDGVFNFRDGTNNLLRIVDLANTNGAEVFSTSGALYAEMSGTGVAVINSATTGTSDTTDKYQSFTPDTDMTATAIVAKIKSTNGTEEATACLYNSNGSDAPDVLIATSNQTLNISATMSHIRFSLNNPVSLQGNVKYILRIALQNNGVGAGCTTTTTSVWDWAISASDIYSGGRSETGSGTDFLFSLEASKSPSHGYIAVSGTSTSSTATKTQSFTPDSDMYLSAVTAAISMAGATEEASICIYDDNGSDAIGTLLAGPYQTLNIGTTVNYARFSLTTPIFLQGGTKYDLRIAGQDNAVGASCTTTTTSVWAWHKTTSSAYAGGKADASATDDFFFNLESTPISPIITLTNGSVIQSSDPTNGEINFGDGTLKVDFGTIDPPYFIDGVKYATYVASMTGQKEETTGVANLTRPEGTLGNFSYQINFPELETASDLGLFYRITDFGQDMRNLVVLLSTNDSRAKVWYERDPTNNRLTIYGNCNCEVSYRLTAPRFDHETWGNIARRQDGRGFQPGDGPDYSTEATEFTQNEITDITDIQDILRASAIVAGTSITIGQTTLTEDYLKLLIGVNGSIQGDIPTNPELTQSEPTLGPITRDEIDKMIDDAIASASASLEASSSAQPEASDSAQLNQEPQDLTVINLTVEQQASFKSEVTFLNSVSLSNTNVAGSFNQDGIFTLDTTEDGLGSQLNVLAGTLYLQNLPTSGGLDLLKGALTIDTQGSVKIAKLEVKDLTVSSINIKPNEEEPEKRFAGSSLLVKGHDLFDVETTAVTQDSLILVTVEGEIPVAVSVTEKVPGVGFRIKLAQIQDVDLSVSYLIINQQLSLNQPQN